jgi:hypothetical protein
MKAAPEESFTMVDTKDLTVLNKSLDDLEAPLPVQGVAGRTFFDCQVGICWRLLLIKGGKK